ncbi:uncharacterized protein BDV17DRAFT_289862 [Aspergillus undulatus]|uniref:uncharacterized protein n=1 Tax=Aspergillus undulatus TaxID=1810928 RepID=UPI003CCE15D9
MRSGTTSPSLRPSTSGFIPNLIREYWDEIWGFSLHVHCQILLPLLRLSAFVPELEEDALVNLHWYEQPGLEYLRYMIYHPRSEGEDREAGSLWARGHTDYNTLTFLFYIQCIAYESNI